MKEHSRAPVTDRAYGVLWRIVRQATGLDPRGAMALIHKVAYSQVAYDDLYRAVGISALNAPSLTEEEAHKSYEAFGAHVVQQFLMLQNAGFMPRLVDHDPFDTFEHMQRHLHAQARNSYVVLPIWRVSPDAHKTEYDVLMDNDVGREYVHPLYEPAVYTPRGSERVVPLTDVTGEMLSMWDAWQFVHDTMTHVALDLPFGFVGEARCFRAHALTFPADECQYAFLNETIIRNSIHPILGKFPDPPRIVRLPYHIHKELMRNFHV